MSYACRIAIRYRAPCAIVWTWLMVSACLPGSAASLAAAAQPADQLTPAEAKAIAQEAYVFGLPLVYIKTQVDALTHVSRPDNAHAPINLFKHYREFPDASNKTIVGLNVDTLYALADLDLSQEPWVLSVPAMGSRFWVMQLIDTWNGVPHAPGSRSVPPPTATTPVGNPVLTISAEAGLDRQAG